MTDTTSHLTPEQEHAFYADPANQEPQGPCRPTSVQAQRPGPCAVPGGRAAAAARPRR